MANKWVCNASPLILLNRISSLELLMELSDSLVIPHGVIEEVMPYEDDTPHWQAFFGSSKVLKIDNAINIEPQIAGWDTGNGESEVLSWAAKHPGYEAILDDLEARKCARSIGVPLRGTIGIILLAKERGLIPKAAPLAKALIDAGLRFDSKWLEAALELVGEGLNIN